MYYTTIILTSRPAGLPACIGRSACRHRPVSMPASAGLYAGQPLFDCVAVPSGGFFFGKKRRPNNKKNVCLRI